MASSRRHKKKTANDAAVIIIGGGLAGLSLAAILGTQSVPVICIDRDDPALTQTEAFDGRTTAISWGSRQILERGKIVSGFSHDACPIDTIKILDGDSDDLLTFDAADVGDKSFGWIVENRLLRQALSQRVKKLPSATHIAPAKVADFEVDHSGAAVFLDDGRVFRAPLLVGADGRQSFARAQSGIGERQWSYRQRAIVCTVAHENSHENIAIEHFHPSGPFAVLPMTDGEDGAYRSSVVWTEHGPQRLSAMTYDDETFDTALNARFPAFYGRVKNISRRSCWPLSLVHAQEYTAPRLALVADAAHGIHPIAGQGLNLGFRDIDALSDLVIDALANKTDPGSPTLLASYERSRRADNMAMAGATDILTRLFSNDIMPLRVARRLGLRAVARLPLAKKFFMTQAMGQKAGYL